MAARTKSAMPTFTIKVTANPDFCGIGAGSAHFAHGEATIHDPQLAEWFKEHDGYEVTEAAGSEGFAAE